MSYTPPQSFISLPRSFSQSLFYISLCQPMFKISVNRYMPYFSSLFKFHLWVFLHLLYFKIHKWLSLFIHVKRYYTSLNHAWSQLNSNEFETSLYREHFIEVCYIYLLSFWYIWLHNPLTFKISLVILFTVCHTIYVMLG